MSISYGHLPKVGPRVSGYFPDSGDTIKERQQVDRAALAVSPDHVAQGRTMVNCTHRAYSPAADHIVDANELIGADPARCWRLSIVDRQSS
jgi:hypothetical protein